MDHVERVHQQHKAAVDAERAAEWWCASEPEPCPHWAWHVCGCKQQCPDDSAEGMPREAR